VLLGVKGLVSFFFSLCRPKVILGDSLRCRQSFTLPRVDLIFPPGRSWFPGLTFARQGSRSVLHASLRFCPQFISSPEFFAAARPVSLEVRF
jgi:hypothetical protein